MSTTNAETHSGTDNLPYNPFETSLSSVKQSKEKALTALEFERLLEGCYDLKGKDALEARFVVLATGRLGMRAGELVHTTGEWLDREESRINIPKHETCEDGRDGGLCGTCTQHAEQMAEHNDVPLDTITPYYWKAKTAKAERSVAYDFSARVELVVERFFDRHDGWPFAKSTADRRLAEALEAAGFAPGITSLHGLRATAASHHAGRGLDLLALQSYFGWANLDTAQHYLALSSERTQNALNAIHGR